jgi:ATP-binding cassette subfamily C protein LapB
MLKSLSKLEAFDESPLDVPGRPMGDLSRPASKTDKKPQPLKSGAPTSDVDKLPGKPDVQPAVKADAKKDTTQNKDVKPRSRLSASPDKIEPKAPARPAPIAKKPEQSKVTPKPDTSTKEKSKKADKKEGKTKRLPPRQRKQQEQEKAAKSPAESTSELTGKPLPAVDKSAPAPAETSEPKSAVELPEQKNDIANTPAPEQSGGGDGGPPPPPDQPGDSAPVVPEPSDAHIDLDPVKTRDIRINALASLRDQTDLSNCLLPLLESLNWRGDPRHIAEAVPHFVDSIDVTSFRNIMATLHFESRPLEIRLHKIDPRLYPCLFLPKDGDAIVLLNSQRGKLNIYDGGKAQYVEIAKENVEGTVLFFNNVEPDEILPQQQKLGWFRAVSERFRSLFYQTLGLTFVLNILALATPLFVMGVYDKVVATGSMKTLTFFTIGVAIAILCDLFLRYIRTRILAFIGARLDNIVGIAVFHKILFLQPAFTERSTIGSQVARIKDFETIRDFFTGAMALTLLELPFVIIFIIVIAVLGGPVAFVPLIMVALYGILTLVFTPIIRAAVSRSARVGGRKQELVVETLGGMRAIKYSGAETTWLDRYRKLSAKSALNGFYASQYSALVQTISHVLMISAGVGTIVFGVFRILEGEMSIGGLVASMMLVWRVLGPLQTGFVSMSRITQVKASIGQINSLMNIRAEREQHSLVNPIKRMDGFVSFSRVSIRYSPDADPALVGVTFDIGPGEVVAVVGGNGSGKSTVLKLMVGMYQAQAGSIRIDNQDIRQLDPVELRHAVAYIPQNIEFFYGTIAQNLRFAHSTASEDDLRWACYKAGVLDEIEAMEQGSGKWKRSGFDVRIGDSGGGKMPTSVLQRLNLARGYLKRSPVMLFDEPGNGLDFEGDKTFMRMVDELRHNSTCMIVTHRPSHLKICDKIVWLEYGNVRAYGPSAEVLSQMPKDFL